jgi:DNA primase
MTMTMTMTMTMPHFKTSERSEELTDLLDMVDPEDFLDWLGVDYVMTRGRSGVQLNIKECPRCGGRERKVYLNAETGLGNCFHGSCVDEPGYNLFSFAKAYFDGSAKDAIDQLKQYATNVGWKPRKAKPLSVSVRPVGGVELPSSYQLPIKGKNLNYLQVRGITLDIVEQLGLRYCKRGHFEYTAPDGAKRQQDYSGRVLIPVRDLEGVVRTFQGRDITGQSDRRYLFPPGLAGTGQFLYNADNALGCETLIIAEGAFDVAATLMALKNDQTVNYGVVGSFGKRISMSVSGEEDQLKQLFALREAGAKRFIFLWDGEVQTMLDACSEAMQLKRFGFETYIAHLPEDKDPNEVLAALVRKAVREATPVTPIQLMKLRARLYASRA